MNRWIILVALCVSCTTPRPIFQKEKVCSNQSLKYLRNPRNLSKVLLINPDGSRALHNAKSEMQQCYEEFKERAGPEVLSTCLVVGVDEAGKREYFRFSAEDAELDQEFIDCAHRVTMKVPYEKFGGNYVLFQAYQFYVR